MELETVLLFYLDYLRKDFKIVQTTYENPYALDFGDNLKKACASLCYNGRLAVKFWDLQLAKKVPSEYAQELYKEIRDKMKTGWLLQRMHSRARRELP